MLSDLERKLLRVLYNFISMHRRVPTEQELTRMIGRNIGAINRALLMLECERYIKWTPGNLASIHVIEGWERKSLDWRKT